MLFLLVPVLTASAAPAWQPAGTRDGISVYSREVPGSPIIAFRGDCEVPASMGKVIGVLADATREKEWMDRLVEARLIKEISDHERVAYNRTSTPWPLADRDFLFNADAKFDPANKRLVIAMRSIEDAAVPRLRGVVRGELLRSVWTLTALGPQTTAVSFEIQADPRGAIPKWIVNLFQSSWPRKTLEALRRQVQKPDVEEYPAFRLGNQ